MKGLVCVIVLAIVTVCARPDLSEIKQSNDFMQRCRDGCLNVKFNDELVVRCTAADLSIAKLGQELNLDDKEVIKKLQGHICSDIDPTTTTTFATDSSEDDSGSTSGMGALYDDEDNDDGSGSGLEMEQFNHPITGDDEVLSGEHGLGIKEPEDGVTNIFLYIGLPTIALLTMLFLVFVWRKLSRCRIEQPRRRETV